MKFSDLQIGQFFRTSHPDYAKAIYLRVPPLAEEDGEFINYHYRRLDITGKSFYAWGRMDDDIEVVLVDAATGLVEQNIGMGRCERCQDLLPSPCLDEKEEFYYDWDNPDSDVAGSFLESRTYYACRDKAQCLANRRKMAVVMQGIAKQQDGAMREAGWGAIGNGARGNYE
jgi:hypothetical protein